MLIAESATVVKTVQVNLDMMWELVDNGEPKSRVVKWLRKGGHESISDWVAIEVAGLIEQDTRKASAVESEP